MQREDLERHLAELLAVDRARDYCPNGLQVEGREAVCRVLCGVTASQALLDEAVRGQFDTIIVHHGYFWKGEDARVRGLRRRRLKTLLSNDINLFAYHLPLDMHPEIGNNAQLGSVLGWHGEMAFGDQDLGWLARLDAPVGANTLCRDISQRLGREALLVGDGDRAVRTVAWCTGGAQGFFEAAIDAGADLYLSGEISEQTTHLARESGVPYVAAGHHATERYGIQALAAHLASHLGLETRFLDIPNPA
ncbi:MAG: Nif3-like dinuclear metal center hexameric protein [Rhodocyclaceae bacterium]|nr:Nif3-like dinuclear metal center hexameric protein [Rhodocyclaceae bacterium]